jgi:hypothetical protein
MNERIDAIYKQVVDEACENPLYRFAELVRDDERAKCASDYLADCVAAVEAAREDERKTILVILETYPTVLEMIKAIRRIEK